MSAKTDTPQQHNMLHQYWGQHNCCLCNDEFRIKQLEKRIVELEALVSEKRTDDSIAVEVATHQGFWDWFVNKTKERLNERIKHDTGLPDMEADEEVENKGVHSQDRSAGDL